MIYDLLAPVYDEINGELDYKKWADFIEKTAIENLKRRPELVLDLASGTGSMTLELASRGYDMIGVDYSTEMLGVARERAEKSGLSVLWLCQDMREFELYGTVDLVVSTLDSINHLTTDKDLKKCFSLVHNYLNPDGIFIFDINGKYKFENIYADRCYSIETNESVCVWQNEYNAKTRLCNFYISLFNELPNGDYRRYDEEQTEKMYLISDMKKALTGAGFEFIGAYSDFENTEATDGDERIYIVAKCKKENLES